MKFKKGDWVRVITDSPYQAAPKGTLGKISYVDEEDLDTPYDFVIAGTSECCFQFGDRDLELIEGVQRNG